MAYISLKQYLDQVDNMIQDGSFDEAVFHCRHILHHYSRNLAAYRLLSTALLGNNMWREAEESLRRVLSVVPDDAMAHYGLGQAYRRLRRLPDAIWHLERAYEQDPTNTTFVESLKDLYAEHQGLKSPRFHLTTAAVAQQYSRNDLHEQAVSVLAKGLEEMPRRVDLRLTLARVQFEAGYTYDAAEIALDVLDALPDCLYANVILAMLWLSEERPSDAQRFLSRVELVDPYLAMEIAQGVAPPEDLFDLPEANYSEAAKRKVVEASPDWLSDIDDTDDFDYVAAAIPTSAAPAAPAIDDDEDFESLFNLGVDEEFTEDEAESLLERPNLSDILGMPEDLLKQIGDAAELSEMKTSHLKPPESLNPDLPRPPRRSGMTGLLAALKSENDDEPQPVEDDIGATKEMDVFGADDDLLEAALEFDTVIDDDETATDTDDDMSWLEDVEDQAVEETPKPKLPKGIAGSDSADPLAWMKQSGIEIVEDSDYEAFDRYGIEEDEGTYQDPRKVDSLAWLKQSGIEVDEQEQKPGFFDDLEENADDNDPLAWLKDSGIEVVNAAKKAAQAEEPEEDEDDWLADDSLLDEMLHLESLTGDDSGFAISPTRTGEIKSDIMDEEAEASDFLVTAGELGEDDDEFEFETEAILQDELEDLEDEFEEFDFTDLESLEASTESSEFDEDDDSETDAENFSADDLRSEFSGNFEEFMDNESLFDDDDLFGDDNDNSEEGDRDIFADFDDEDDLRS